MYFAILIIGKTTKLLIFIIASLVKLNGFVRVAVFSAIKIMISLYNFKITRLTGHAVIVSLNVIVRLSINPQKLKHDIN